MENNTSFLDSFKESPEVSLKKLMDNQQLIIACGYEGCNKSRLLIKIALELYPSKTVYACKSYSMLKDKQKEIMETYNLKEFEVPIVSLKFDQAYKDYYTNPSNPFHISDRAKIILVTQASLQRNLLEVIFSKNAKRKQLYSTWDSETKQMVKIKGHHKPSAQLIILDEFEPSVGIIPSLEYNQTCYTKQVNESTSRDISKDGFMNFLKEEYSNQDFIKQKAFFEANNFHQPFVANWIEKLQYTQTKLVVATSETLAVKLLKSIGFSACELDYTSDFSNHIVDIDASPNFTKAFIQKVNAELAWGKFGFKTIISDSYRNERNQVEEIEIPKDTFKVINHTLARGSNEIAKSGDKLLTIITAIPNPAIKSFQECLQYFCKEEIPFEKIKATFYRDRLMQAVSRVIGHRGIWKNNYQTNVLCSEDIFNCLFEIDQETKTIKVKDPSLLIPYSFKHWDFNNVEIEELLQKTEEDKRIKREEDRERNKSNLADKRHLLATNNFNVLARRFKSEPQSRIEYEDFKLQLDKLCLYSATNKPLRPGVVARMFDGEVKKSSVRIDGKIIPIRYVVGIALKESENV
jgi:hypothetical protein